MRELVADALHERVCELAKLGSCGKRAQQSAICDGAVKRQTLPQALEYLWQGYPIEGRK